MNLQFTALITLFLIYGSDCKESQVSPFYTALMSKAFSFCPSCYIFTLSHAAAFFNILFHKLPLTACH